MADALTALASAIRHSVAGLRRRERVAQPEDDGAALRLYDVEVPTINCHLKKVFEDSELEEDSVIRNFRIAAADGKTYDTKHYDLWPSSPLATRSTPSARCSFASSLSPEEAEA